MKRVLVIGAGGSLAQAHHYRPVRSRHEYPPLDLDFFTRALELAGRHKDVSAALRRLRRALGQMADVGDPWKPTPASLEQFFADIYYEVVTRRQKSDAFEVFIALLGLYALALEVTTNWMTGRRPGVVGQLLRHERERAGNDTPIVVTFNHDLVIENEVATLPRIEGQWCLTGLYADAELDPVHASAGPWFPNHNDGCVHRSPIILLKLHGSLNWVVRMKSQDPRFATLFPPASRPREVFVHDSRQARHLGASIGGAGGAGRAQWYAWPLIVPPVFDKQRVLGTGVLESMWSKAQMAIGEAESLLLLGYSLPDADIFARQMLRRAFGSNPRLEEVDCINPDASIAVKLKQVLGCRVIRTYQDIETYLKYSS